MAGNIIAVEDTMNGLEGQIIVTINGSRRVLAEATSISTTYTIEKATQKAIGRRNAMSKPTGGTGTGTMNILYGASDFVALMEEYQRSGKPTYFSLLVENNDSASDRGTIRRLYKNCSIDSIELSKLDASESYLNQDIPFTWEEFQTL